MSRPLLWVGAGVGVVGLGLLFTEWPVGLALLVASLAVLAVAVVVVRADQRGVHVGFGPLHWPSVNIGLDDVAAARAEFIDPMNSGGWGYRFTPRGRAVVLRAGDGLLVERTSGPDFVVTVDRADEAAGVVNALVSRQERH